VIVNSHGGNDEVMGIVARELRVRADMLVVKSAWSRLGKPAGPLQRARAEIRHSRR
jgi:creatinine amidohydrolase